MDGLKIFENDPLVSPPGTKFNYSSYGYNLLSAIVESASGENFLAYMQKRVFDAMGLAHTAADQNAQIVKQRSRFYEKEKDGTLENAPYVDNSYKWAGGGFLSTSEDLVRFGSMLLQPGFLRADSLKLLSTSQKTKSGEETGYGMGWGDQEIAIGENGVCAFRWFDRGNFAIDLYPETCVVVALVTNLSSGEWKAEEVEAVAKKFERGKK